MHTFPAENMHFFEPEFAKARWPMAHGPLGSPFSKKPIAQFTPDDKKWMTHPLCQGARISVWSKFT